MRPTTGTERRASSKPREWLLAPLIVHFHRRRSGWMVEFRWWWSLSERILLLRRAILHRKYHDCAAASLQMCYVQGQGAEPDEEMGDRSYGGSHRSLLEDLRHWYCQKDVECQSISRMGADFPAIPAVADQVFVLLRSRMIVSAEPGIASRPEEDCLYILSHLDRLTGKKVGFTIHVAETLVHPIEMPP